MTTFLMQFQHNLSSHKGRFNEGLLYLNAFLYPSNALANRCISPLLLNIFPLVSPSVCSCTITSRGRIWSAESCTATDWRSVSHSWPTDTERKDPVRLCPTAANACMLASWAKKNKTKKINSLLAFFYAAIEVLNFPPGSKGKRDPPFKSFRSTAKYDISVHFLIFAFFVLFLIFTRLSPPCRWQETTLRLMLERREAELREAMKLRHSLTTLLHALRVDMEQVRKE